MVFMLAHIAQTGYAQIPLLTNQLDAARLTDPLWILRVVSIEARPCVPDSCRRHIFHLPDELKFFYGYLMACKALLSIVLMPLSRPTCWKVIALRSRMASAHALCWHSCWRHCPRAALPLQQAHYAVYVCCLCLACTAWGAGAEP